MLDDQIGYSDYARKKFKKIELANFSLVFRHLVSNLAPKVLQNSSKFFQIQKSQH